MGTRRILGRKGTSDDGRHPQRRDVDVCSSVVDRLDVLRVQLVVDMVGDFTLIVDFIYPSRWSKMNH